ncbi:alpha/beta fold hydrolase [Microbacterium sp. BWT-B31]|uniref:alpha/beta hydrolase n=1 Tax=Microbacterium sp. BWT-B31 TaxID=3232072 RepID=UPI0035298065
MPNLFRFAGVMMNGLRQPVDRTPAEVGLDYEDVSFPSTDGIGLRGWFIPAGVKRAPTVVWVHGWPWNRLGNVAGRVPWRDRTVDHLPPTKALHDAGLNVLMFDLASHGESGDRLPLTYGMREKNDYVGAVRYLRTRPDVDPERIGAIGMSAGGSTVLYGTAECQPIRALVAIQPTKVSIFSRNMARTEFGPLGPLFAQMLNIVYWFRRAPLPNSHDPSIPARGLGDTVVQYVQGTGDQWGQMQDVEHMSAVTPNSAGVIRYPSTERYSGYQYISTNTDELVEFFTKNL